MMAVVCLLVLLGASLVSTSPVHSKPNDLPELHKSIVNHLDLTVPEVGREPLFTSVIRSLNSSCQGDVMLMNATLDVYMRIFTSLHNNLGSIPVAHNIMQLENHTSKLKSRLSRLQQNKEDLISRVNAIKVDDQLVQKKALAEFMEVYVPISELLGSRNHRHTH